MTLKLESGVKVELELQNGHSNEYPLHFYQIRIIYISCTSIVGQLLLHKDQPPEYINFPFSIIRKFEPL